MAKPSARKTVVPYNSTLHQKMRKELDRLHAML
jgi:hypothetical protein